MFDQFLQERTYLKGVSPETIRYYKCVEKAFEPILANPSKEGVMACIVKMRSAGVSPISVNCYVRGLNAYFMWLHKEHGKERIKIPKLKEEQKILATLTPENVTNLLRCGSKLRGDNERRAWLVALTIIDCGLRASEALGLTKNNVDLDNLVFKIRGKGSKERLVPFSFELRKMLFRHILQRKHGGKLVPVHYIFGTKYNTPVTVRNLERDFKMLGKKLGITGVRFSPHTLRHSFAVMYLRGGGNLEFLRRILGHSSILTTQKYLKSLGVEDLGAVHNSFSPLSARR